MLGLSVQGQTTAVTDTLLRTKLNFAAKHGVHAKTKSHSRENLNELMGGYHRGPGGSWLRLELVFT